ncbi:MAG: methyltransferase family protein [Candidatus Hermodarchaeota archaeon]
MKNLIERINFILLMLVGSIFLFYISVAVYGWDNWGFAILNITFFGTFILFTQVRKRVTHLPESVYLAFIIALYAEMYGFPLTLYIFTWLFGYNNVYTLGHLLSGVIGENLFAYYFHMVILPVSNIIILIGIFLIIFGWRRIFKSKGELVTTGIYGYVRHPQYLGILLLTIGMNIQWPTIFTLLIWPLLVILYYRLAKKEEKEMEKRIGEQYREYKKKVPMLIPRLRMNRNFE